MYSLKQTNLVEHLLAWDPTFPYNFPYVLRIVLLRGQNNRMSGFSQRLQHPFFVYPRLRNSPVALYVVVYTNTFWVTTLQLWYLCGI
jgi:hypothetical protein